MKVAMADTGKLIRISEYKGGDKLMVGTEILQIYQLDLLSWTENPEQGRPPNLYFKHMCHSSIGSIPFSLLRIKMSMDRTQIEYTIQ